MSRQNTAKKGVKFHFRAISPAGMVLRIIMAHFHGLILIVILRALLYSADDGKRLPASPQVNKASSEQVCRWILIPIDGNSLSAKCPLNHGVCENVKFRQYNGDNQQRIALQGDRADLGERTHTTGYVSRAINDSRYALRVLATLGRDTVLTPMESTIPAGTRRSGIMMPARFG